MQLAAPFLAALLWATLFWATLLWASAVVAQEPVPNGQELEQTTDSDTAKTSRRSLPPPYDKGTCINGWCRTTSCGIEAADGPLMCRYETRVGTKPKREVVCEGIEGPCQEYDVEVDPATLKRNLLNGRQASAPRSCKRVCRRYLKNNPWVRPSNGTAPR